MKENPQKPSLNPSALTITDAALLLTKVGGQPVTTAMIDADRVTGAPVNSDGSINLVHYAAWLLKETERGD